MLNREDTDGSELKWNDPATVFELIHQIAAGKQGFAREVGRGIRHMKAWIAERASSKNGRTRADVLKELDLFGMETKGLEFSMYITKESLAQQGGYGFALKGPQHDEAWLIALDQIKNEMPTFEQKAAALRWFPLFRTWFNIAGLCKLPWIDVRHPEAAKTSDPAKNFPTIEYYLEMVNATLGTDKTLDDLLTESERCHLMHKLINLRQGFGTREFDRIPMRAMAPVFMDEFHSRKDYYMKYLEEKVGVNVNSASDEDLLKTLHEYRREQYELLTDAVYKEKGYDLNGIPLDATLTRLGFDKPEYISIVEAARARVLSLKN
jgi:aldehyde:ferredoxin oxidoreductase